MYKLKPKNINLYPNLSICTPISNFFLSLFSEECDTENGEFQIPESWKNCYY